MPAIKRAETEQELQDIYRFRYRVYVEEMRRKQEYRNDSSPIDAFLGIQVA